MPYTNLRVINDLGGIEAQVAEGHFAYFPPGTDLHDQALAGDFGPVAAFVPPEPPAQEDPLVTERAQMRAFRLAWEDAAALLPYGPGTLLDAIDALLDAVPPALVRRYGNITIFERLRPEVAAFLMSPEAINLPPEAVDALFRLAMALEEQRADDAPAHVAEWAAALA